MDAEGHIQVPTTPGIGYEVDQEALDQYTLEIFEFTKESLLLSN